MGGWVKVTLGLLVAALVAVLIVSFTGGDDSTSPSTATVADGQSKGPAGAKGAKESAGAGSKKGGANGVASVEEEAGFTGSSGAPEEQSDDSNGSGGSGKGSKGGGKVGGSDATSHGSKKKKKKKKSKAASQAPQLDPETAAASAVLEAYMAARAAQNWPTACAQMTPRAIRSLERFAGAGRGCAATFAAFYPHLAPGSWDNTMTGPITSLRADGVAIYHGTTGRDYAMPMLKEGGGWKVAAVGPIAVS